MLPLSVLDLSPVVAGGTAAQALRETTELARHVEQLGYRRFWVAEHHLAPGVASSSPAVLSGAVLARTEHIRVGSGAVLLGVHTPLEVAEDFGTLAHLHPDRVDLGLGRSGLAKAAELAQARCGPPRPREPRVVDGLPVPRAARRPASRASAERLTAQARLLGAHEGEGEYQELVEEVLDWLDGTFLDGDGIPAGAITAEGAPLDVWVLGASAGPSARAAGELGLPFVANYHTTPGTVLETAAAYRESFAPSKRIERPRLVVSADVLVAEDDATARHLAEPFAEWVHEIRYGEGAPPYAAPEDAARRPWTDDELEGVADRLETRIVGSPETAVERLEVLGRATGADELMITTIAHDHRHRLRSYKLLAEAWAEQST